MARRDARTRSFACAHMVSASLRRRDARAARRAAVGGKPRDEDQDEDEDDEDDDEDDGGDDDGDDNDDTEVPAARSSRSE